jgi:hypothetical protein
MSPDFWILLVSAVFAAFGTAVAIRLKVSRVATVLAVVVYALVGVHAVFLAALTGDGRLIPGLQLSPGVQRYWTELLLAERIPASHPALGLFAVVAHLLVLLPRPSRRTLLYPLPATLVFLLLIVILQKRTEGRPILHHRADGPGQTAFLTIAPVGEGSAVRMIVASGEAGGPFLCVRHVHRADSPPPKPRLYWTRDGEGIVLTVRSRRLLGLDLDGGVAGWLPEERHEWPSAAFKGESPATQRRLTRAERDVAEFVKNHHGIYVR